MELENDALGQLKRLERHVIFKTEPMAKSVLKQWIYFMDHEVLKFQQLRFINKQWIMYTLSVDGTLEQPHEIDEELIILYLKGEVTTEHRSIDYRLDSFMCNLLGKVDLLLFEKYGSTKTFYRFMYQWYNNELLCKTDPSNEDAIHMMTSDPIFANPHPEMIIGKSGQEQIDDSIFQPNFDHFPE